MGSSSGGSSGAADRAEQERQARIDQTIAAIRAAFEGPASVASGAAPSPVQVQATPAGQPPITQQDVFREMNRLSTSQLRAVTPAEALASLEQSRSASQPSQAAGVAGPATVPAPGGSPRRDLIEDLRGDVLELNLDELREEKSDAERGLRFDLARRGLSGGSADAFLGGELLERFNEGVGRVSEFADTAANRLRAADQQAKQSLIRDAQLGLDATTAQQQALEALQTNLAEARGATRLEGLGNLFAGLAGTLDSSARARGVASASPPGFVDPTRLRVAPLGPQSLRGAGGRTTTIGR